MSNSPKISIRVSNDMLDWLNLQTNDGYKTKTKIITDILKQHKEGIQKVSDNDDLQDVRQLLINGAKQNNQTLEDYVYNLIVKDLDYMEYSFFSPGNLKYLNNLAKKNKIPYKEIVNELLIIIKGKEKSFVERIIKRITDGFVGQQDK